MPELPSDRQYQLWALIDNDKKDLGVFDATRNNVILKMKDTKRAQAFAITIERKGGAPHPTLDSLQSLGKTEFRQ
jgi:anti-sigma-K factor RskA